MHTHGTLAQMHTYTHTQTMTNLTREARIPDSLAAMAPVGTILGGCQVDIYMWTRYNESFHDTPVNHVNNTTASQHPGSAPPVAYDQSKRNPIRCGGELQGV